MVCATWVIAALLAVAAGPSVGEVAPGAQSEAAKRLDRLAEALEQGSRRAFMFTDSTGAVLPKEAGASDNLRFGGEFWHERIDAVGESNLMGHQGIAVGDFDGNGLEDLYVAMGTGLPNLLLVQGADGTLRDIAEQAGVAWLDDTKGVLFADTDNDGDQDLLMAIGPTIVLAKNGGNGKFERFVSMRAPTPDPFYSLSAADYDLDGDLDIYGTRSLHDAENGPTNHLLRNDGEDRFTDVTTASGLSAAAGQAGAGGTLIDLNNDGLEDRVVQSGERNSCFVNLGDGTFADATFASGLDFTDDGRAVAAVDWDGDGDLDLWLKNRSGPQLRLMRNDHGGGEHFLGLRLEGTLANRDAIGAQVDLQAGNTTLVRSVAAGDGYLSQSSKRIHFGLGEALAIDRVTIRWPGGKEERFGSLAVDRDYRIRQGSGVAVALPRREIRLPAAPAETGTARGPSRVLLREPLPLPPTLARVAYGEAEPSRVAWIQPWTPECSACLEEQARLAARHAELQQAGIDVITVALAHETQEVIAAILHHVLRRQGELPLPMSLLVDRQGRLQMIYLGPLGVDPLLADAASYGVSSDVKAERRSLWHGRWYFRTPRALTDLASDLKRRGLREDARFYVALAPFAEEAGR